MREFIEAIEAALREHPLSRQILQFLMEHEGAMDTIDGVAKCWVNSDPVAVRSVLDSLQHAGIVVTRVLSSGTYYRLTTDAEVQQWLKSYCSGLNGTQRAHASANDWQPHTA